MSLSHKCKLLHDGTVTDFIFANFANFANRMLGVDKGVETKSCDHQEHLVIIAVGSST